VYGGGPKSDELVKTLQKAKSITVEIKYSNLKFVWNKALKQNLNILKAV